MLQKWTEPFVHNSPTAKRILLVEDEPIIALAESQMLKKAGYECLVASTGERAIELIAGGEPIDLILMDINLGKGIDGTETAQRILEEKDIPIVFLSCHTAPEIVNKTERITSYGYIVKTSGDTVVLASIRMAFRLWEAHQEIVHAGEILRIIASTGAESSEQVFRCLVQILANLFNSTYAFISLIDPQDPEKAHTLAVWTGSGLGENFTYDLSETPCAQVLEEQWCFIESNAKEKFPNNRLLSDMGIESYLGIILKEENDRPIGILAVMDTKPIQHHPWNQDILRVIAERTKVEVHRMRLERELVRKERVLQSLLEGIPLPIFHKDRLGRYLGVNEAFCRLLHKSKEEVIGKTAFDIAPLRLARFYAEKDEEVFRQEKEQMYEAQLQDGSGTLHTVRFYKSPYRDEEGRVIGLVGIVLGEIHES